MTGGPEQSAGEEWGDARLRAGRVRWQVGPERALRGSRPVWADRVREGVGLGTCWAERGSGEAGRAQVAGLCGMGRCGAWAKLGRVALGIAGLTGFGFLSTSISISLFYS